MIRIGYKDWRTVGCPKIGEARWRDGDCQNGSIILQRLGDGSIDSDQFARLEEWLDHDYQARWSDHPGKYLRKSSQWTSMSPVSDLIVWKSKHWESGYLPKGENDVSENVKTDGPIAEADLKKLLLMLEKVSFGSITLIIQNGKVVQIERNEKLRLK